MTSYSYAIQWAYEAERTLAYTSIGTSAYVAVGTALAHPARTIVLQNWTNAPVSFSFDKSTSFITLQSQQAMVLDIASNQSKQSGQWLAEGSQLYVKAISSLSSGSVYFSVMYAKGD